MSGRPTSTVPLIIGIGVLVAVGLPLVYVLWTAVNLLLAGRPGEIRFPLVLPVLLAFIALLYGVSRLIIRWERGESPSRRS